MVHALSQQLALGSLLAELTAKFGGYDLVDHWQQGEFHHDVVLRVPEPSAANTILIVATNCNGGVKEILRFATLPDRSALWHHRCPDNPEFAGSLPPVLDTVRTIHWFDPCELLGPEARSEYREDVRERQPGGGWMLKSGSSSGGGACRTRSA